MSPELAEKQALWIANAPEEVLLEKIQEMKGRRALSMGRDLEMITRLQVIFERELERRARHG